MTAFTSLNEKPTFSEFLEMRLRDDPEYFLHIIQKNYTLGEVLVYRVHMESDDMADSFFREASLFLSQLRVVDGCEICTSHDIFSIFFSDPLVYVQEDDAEHPEVRETVTMQDVHTVFSSEYAFAELAGCALMPVYTSISESVGMYPFRSAHIDDGNVVVSAVGGDFCECDCVEGSIVEGDPIVEDDE